jgi:protoheme IX farnesyltransferase
MFLSVPGWPAATALIFGTLGIGLAASSAAVFNHVLDARTDIRMMRTRGGAAPPVLGWTAVTGEISSSALLLFLIIFVWTPPHFWALAIARKEEYEKVGIPMLPVTHGEDYTRLNILLYTVLLVLITIIPYLTGMSGLIYLTTALALDAVFLYHAIQMRRNPADVELPMRTFKFSITYLGILFAALLVDHYFLFQLSFQAGTVQ